MRLRSIRYLGWLKLVFMTNLALPLVALSILLPLSLVFESEITFNPLEWSAVGPFNVSIVTGSLVGQALVAAALFLANMAFIAWVLKLIARWTPLGHIRV